jgi:hypothetical protein
VQGRRFVALVEQAGSGSRIRGIVVLSPLTRILLSLLILAAAFAATAALAEGREPSVKVVAIASAMITGALFMVRYSLRWTSRLVEARLRQCLDAPMPRAVA